MSENRIAQNFGALGLLRYALPTVCMMLFTSIYTMVDGVFVAQFVSVNALSALNIVNPMFSFVMGFGVMLGAGGSAVVAKNIGEGDEKLACQNLSTLVLFGVLLGLVLMIVLVLFMDALLVSLGATEVLLPLCEEYCWYIMPFLVAWVLELMFSSYFITAGTPKLGLIATLCSGLFNMVGDYFLIVVFDVGIKGAAIATGLATCIPVIVGLVYFFNKKHSLHFERPVRCIRMILKSCTNGISEMISNLAAMVITLSYNLIMIRLAGEQGVAAITVILYLEFLFTAGFYGFASGIAPIISYNYGAGKKDQLKRIVKDAYGFVIAGSIIVYAISMIGNEFLVGIFATPGTDLFYMASQGLRIFAAGFLFAGVSLMTSNMFTALSNGAVSATISLLRSFVFVLACLILFSNWWGVTGVWCAVPVAEVLSIIVCVIFLLALRKRYFA
ncbi:MATE family efflux transporter [Anaerotardibacter muris]|uniref:MATE family efflux transporter n=1 Tax=Anaerotardibacter muris TaxID=2941505 RepID=UPI00203AF496|nr:MATE family efflux transporter [Anaerotardibacter muris]